MGTTEINLEGEPFLVTAEPEKLEMTVHAYLKGQSIGTGPLSTAAGPRIIRLKHRMSAERALPWAELAAKLPDCIAFFVPLDRYHITGRGWAYVVRFPEKTSDADCRGWLGRPVVLNGVAFRVSGVERHAIVREDWSLCVGSLLVGPPLDVQPFRGHPGVEIPAPGRPLRKGGPF